MAKKFKKAPKVSPGLRKISNQGVRLYIDGEEATADDVALRCVSEGNRVYIADYVIDEKGRLTEIRYGKVVHYY
jgi:hypothetical protein